MMKSWMFGLVFLPVMAFATQDVYTPLVSLGENTNCVKCEGYLLPGKTVERDDFVYAIHSDLPEIFHTPGVLYTTKPVLPPFDTFRDGPLDEGMRTQLNHGFTSIDDNFEVFIYHLSEPGGGNVPRRILVHVENLATEGAPIPIELQWSFEGAGKMGSSNGPETRLAYAVGTNDFPNSNTLTLAPGASTIAAWTPLIAAAEESPDSTKSGFITGIVRGIIAKDLAEKPNLHVTVLAIPGETVRENWDVIAREMLKFGAKSGETAMDLRIPPPPCHLRRVVGVYRNFRWHGGGRFNVAKLPEREVRFQMALPRAQAEGCEDAIQTGPMLLHPGYVHPETIGNYTIDYTVDFKLDNPSDVTRMVDIRFGKQDASVGLLWRVAHSSTDEPGEYSEPVTGWAGAWTKDDDPDNSRSFLSDGPILIPPDQERLISIDYTIIGTSSLPFQIHLVSEVAE